jgi:hypothetical protein
VWSTTPPRERFTRVDPRDLQARVDALPRRSAAGLIDDDITVEASAVVVERDGTPMNAILSGLTGDGRRCLANSRDASVMTALMAEAWEGRRVRCTNDGSVNLVG